MKRELKEKWLEALRSGEYPQGKGALHRASVETSINATPGEVERTVCESHTYCCLGVLIDVADVGPWVEAFSDGAGEKTFKVVGMNTYIISSSNPLYEQFGKTPEERDRIIGTLAVANDNGGSFELIATIVDALVPVDQDYEVEA